MECRCQDFYYELLKVNVDDFLKVAACWVAAFLFYRLTGSVETGHILRSMDW